MSDKPGKNTDAWLADEASVSRAYRKLDQAQPPGHLDDAILAEARRAAASQDNTVIRVQRWRQWTMPAALAATVVFAIPLVVRVFDTAPSEFELGRSATTVAERTSTEPDMAYQDLAEQESAALTDAVGPQAVFDEQRVAAKAASPAETAPDGFLLEEQISQSRVEPSVAALQNESFNDSAPAPPPAVAMAAEPRSLQSDRVDSSAIASNESDSKQNAGLSTAADETSFAKAPRPAPDNAADLSARPAREVLAQSPSDSQRQDRRRMTSLSSSVSADDAPDPANRLNNQWLEPTQWLNDIARLHERGHSDNSRRELGLFFSVYPDYKLPADFPLAAKDAQLGESITIDNATIVPEATTWLRGIGLMAYRGDMDQARTQLARFFRIYPNYPLPADFPLSREDALPIER